MRIALIEDGPLQPMQQKRIEKEKNYEEKK